MKWFYSVASNATIDYLRRISVKERRQKEEDTRPPAPVDPQDEIVEQEKVDAIKEDIQRLPAGEREVADLMIQGYKRGEISKILNIPLGTVDSRIGRIRKKLRHHRRNRKR